MFYHKEVCKLRRPKPIAGFALVIALGIMSFVLLLLLSISTLVQVNVQSAATAKSVLLARQNAILGLQVALGELQAQVGPDQRITANAALLDSNPSEEAVSGVEQPYWMGVWDAFTWDRTSNPSPVTSSLSSASDGKPSVFRKWLVSGFRDDTLSAEEQIELARSFSSSSTDAVELLGAGTLGDSSTTDSVYVLRESIEEISSSSSVVSGFAYWVADEGQKARVESAAMEPSSDFEHVLNVSSATRANLHSIYDWDAISFEDDDAEKIYDYASLAYLAIEDSGAADIFDDKFLSVTPYATSLLTDSRNGGLKTDLSILFDRSSLPSDYDDVSLFEIGSASGPTWNYLKRYHERYKMLDRQTDGTASIDILDVKPEIDNSLAPDKAGDAPLPVVVRFQYIFSLYKGRNTATTEEKTTLEGVETNDEIVYLMVTPVIYLWNPYNVSIEMPQDREAALNVLPAFPSLQFSFAGSEYRSLEDIFWTYNGNLIAMEGSNATDEAFIIPPGELRMQVLVDGVVSQRLYMSSTNKDTFYGYDADGNGQRNVNLTLDYSEGTPGLFSPSLINGTDTASPDTKLSAVGSAELKIRFDPSESQFAFLTNIGSETLGDRQQAGIIQVDSTDTLVGTALPQEYTHDEVVNLAGLPELYSGGLFTGLSPKFSVDFSLRAFEEDEGIGKPGLYTDPANAYYYSVDSDEEALAVAPFTISFESFKDQTGDFVQFDTTTQKAFFKSGTDIVESNVARELPVAPLLSIGQFEHAPLGREYQHIIYQNTAYGGESSLPTTYDRSDSERRTMAPTFNRPVGNSFSHPQISSDQVWDNAYGVDYAYFLNDVLMDGYFLSGIADQEGPLLTSSTDATTVLDDFLSGSADLPNANYSLIFPDGYDLSDVSSTLDISSSDSSVEPYKRLAAFLAVQGGFNINSTSVDAWAAVLSGLRDHDVLYYNSTSGAYVEESNPELTPMLPMSLPSGSAVETISSSASDAELELWRGYRSLSDSEIRGLAQGIVREVKARGPFRSLSEFVNREISTRSAYNLQGAVQAAIASPGTDVAIESAGTTTDLNTSSDNGVVASALASRFDSNEMNSSVIDSLTFNSPESLYGDLNEGLPGYLTQAEVLKPLLPLLSPRSDTFVVRSYGDVEVNGSVKTQVWCEAVVQRYTDYVDGDGSELEPWDSPVSGSIQDLFGRKLKVISFRWLDADEV
jgi:hypothetical protein